MTWRDRLVPDESDTYRASFTGGITGTRIEFATIESEDTFGHRTAISVPPFTNGAESRLLGKMPRRFQVTAIFIGDDYDLELKDFIELVENEPRGELRHWVYGLHYVTIERGVQVRHNTRRNGMAEVRFTAVETPRGGLAEFSRPTDSPLALAQQAADAAEESAISDFDRIVAFAGEVQSIQDRIVDDMTSALQRVNDTVASVISITALPGEIVDSSIQVISAAGAVVNDNLAAFTTNIASLMNAPGDLAAALAGEMQLAAVSINRLGDAVSGLSTTSAQDPGVDVRASALTSATDTATQNSKQARALTRSLTAINSVRSLLDLGAELGTENAAQTVLDNVRKLIDDMMLFDNAGSETTAHLYTMLAQASRFVDELIASGDLLKVTDYTVPHTMPACVLGQLIHGSTRYEADIISRNEVAHPLAVPGGTVIQVISPSGEDQ